MASFWRLVNDVIRKSEVLLLVLDSRFPELTRNREIEQKIREQNKRIVYVLNKCDLVEDVSIDSKPFVRVSSRDKKTGGMRLFRKIMELSRGEPVTVGVLGYPNTGKSSVINLLKGKKSARTSSYSGFTRGVQNVKAKGKIMLIDTPGVLSFKDDDIEKQVLIGSRNPQQLKEPEYFAMIFIDKYPKMFEKYYNVKYEGDSDDMLAEIADKNHVLAKGGIPDVKRMARQLLYDWQQGKIHARFLEKD